MKTIEDMAHEYAEALNDIADILDMPTGSTAAQIVTAARDRWARYLCRIKLPLPVRFVADLATLFAGKNVRMKDVGGYLCIFSENT
jgi:hypothetical protein